MNTVTLSTRVSRHPIMTMRFISIMHFHLPNPIISPDMRAPIADPAVVTDCTIVY